MLIRRLQNRSRRSGTALVEFAFVAPIFFLFLLGIFEYGRYLFTMHVVYNAAREGCRYAVTHTQDIVVNNQIDAKGEGHIRTNVVTPMLFGVALNAQSINVYRADGNGNNTGNYLDAPFGDFICCRIQGTYVPIVKMVLPNNIPMNVRIVMRSEAS